ncbi:hypothetical protein JNUCC64_31445 [Streptomyces sp. JNUCC 64]
MRAIVRTSGAVAAALVLALGAAPSAGAREAAPPGTDAAPLDGPDGFAEPPALTGDEPPALTGDEVPSLTGDGAPVREQPPAAWEVEVTPTRVAPGGTVTLLSRGCRVPRIAVDSGVFSLTEIVEGRSAPAVVSAEAVHGAEHEVTFTCDGRDKVVRVVIENRDQGARESARPRPDEGGDPADDTRKGVRAGVGGDFGRIGPVQLALGGTLVAGAVAFGVYTAVRRRGSR